MDCEERDRLARRYAAFLSDYRRSLDVLEGMTGVMARDTYRRVKEGAEQAKRQAEKTRIELESHIAGHRCGECAADCKAACAS
jgi:hypothetical protein